MQKLKRKMRKQEGYSEGIKEDMVKSIIMILKLLDRSWQQDNRRSTIFYTYNVMTNVKTRMLESWLQLKDCVIVKYREQEGGQKWEGEKEREGGEAL